MGEKKLQANSIYAQFDTDGDGTVTDEEMNRAERMIRIENEDKKEDQIRQMAWFALWGMLLYPATIIITSIFGLEGAAKLVSDIAPTYFVAIAGLVAAFFGAQAYTKAKDTKADK